MFLPGLPDLASDPRFAIPYLVIGAGHGGKAMAAFLALRGFPTALYNRTPARIAQIRALGGIDLELEDGTRHFAQLRLVTSDIREALVQARVIMVAVPSSAHSDLATLCAPFLQDGQIVVLHPGRTFGAIEFAHAVRTAGCVADIVIAEAQTFLFASRSNGPAEVRIYRTKNAIPLAALPARRTREALAAVTPAFPQFVAAPNVLHTSLDNMGAIFHPALTVLNAGRIENTQGDFQFYVEGLTPAVARVLEALDRERVTVAASLGIRAQSAREWLDMAYNATGADLYEAMHNNTGYQGIKAPPTLAHRYIFEDVPMSLVPIASAGQQFGVSTAAIDTIVRLASLIHGTDYRSRGRTMAKLGLANLTVEEIRQLVEEGDESGAQRLSAPVAAATAFRLP